MNLTSVKPATARRCTKLLSRFDVFVAKMLERVAKNLDPRAELDSILAEFVD